MDSISIRVESSLQALMAEQAVAMAKQLEAASQAAPDGKVLSRLEQLAVEQGREFTRKSLEAALQVEAETVEKNERRSDELPV